VWNAGLWFGGNAGSLNHPAVPFGERAEAAVAHDGPLGVSEQTFYRWKKKYSGLEIDQVRQLKQMAEENTRLKRIVADLTLDKAMLQDVLRKKF
jgi:hypothetical protein